MYLNVNNEPFAIDLNSWTVESTTRVVDGAQNNELPKPAINNISCIDNVNPVMNIPVNCINDPIISSVIPFPVLSGRYQLTGFTIIALGYDINIQ